MQSKKDYLIWREKDGFFSAMDQEKKIETWSLATGAKLYSIETSKICENKIDFKNFEIYKGNSQDQSYGRDYFNFNDKSLSLIVEKEIIPKPQSAKKDEEKEKIKNNSGNQQTTEKTQPA